jgi:hypothetical protein
MATRRYTPRRRTLTPEQIASNARIEAAHEATRQVVKSGICPDCGGKVKRNLSLTGWWQCEQLGAVGFRKDASKPSCNWQGFTE